MSGSIQFSGYSVTSIKSDCGWGSQESSMTFNLVADPGNIALGVSFDSAPDLSEVLGKPSVFALDTGFSFQGILEHFNRSGSQSGLPLFEAKIIDPRFLLSNYQIIIKDYSGQVMAPNVLNAYGALGFVDSNITSSGMYFDVIRYAVDRFTNNPLPNSAIYGGPMIFNGVRYSVDLSQIPSYTGITFSDFSISLLDLVQRMCDQLALDFFVELDGFIIRIRTVSTFQQIPTTALQNLIANGTGNNVSSFSNGLSIAKENTTSKMLVGPNIEQILLTNKGSRYYGKDFNGNPIFGQPTKITLSKRSLNNGKFPVENEEEVNGWFRRSDGWLTYEVYTDIVPVLIKNNKLAYLLGNTILISTLFEIEIAHEAKIGINDDGNDFDEYLKKFRYNLYLALGGDTGNNGLHRDTGFGKVLAAERGGVAGISEYEANRNLLLEALNETYSEMGFAFSIGDQISVRNEGNKWQYSREVVSSAWFKEFEDGQVQFSGGFQNNKFVNSSDLRFKAFLVSSKEVSNSISWNLGGYLVPTDGSPETVLAVPGNQSSFSIPLMSSPTFVTNDLTVYTYGMVFEKQSYPIWNTVMAVLKSDSIDAGQKTVKLKTPIGSKTRSSRLMDTPNNPTAAGIPVKDYLSNYGPWGTVGRPGRTECELDSTLTPWNWGNTELMNIYGRQKVSSNISFLQVNEEGDITIAGLPNTEFGNIMQFVGVSISSININIDSKSGFQTTYRFRRFSPKLGTFNQAKINQLRSLSDGVKDTRQRILDTTSQLDYSVSELSLSARAGRDAIFRAKRQFNKLDKKKQSPHLYFMSVTSASITENNKQVISNNIETGDEEDAARFAVGYYSTSLPNIAAMSLDGLIRPFYNYYGSLGEIPLSLESQGIYTPVLTDPENEMSTLNSINLNPFNVYSDIQSIFANSFKTGQNQLSESSDTQNVKPFALRGPLMLSGWGFDRYTLQAVPKVGNDRISEPYPSNNDNKEFTVQQANSFKTGPVDLVWDEARGVWTNNSIATFYIPTSGSSVPPGKFADANVYINDLQSLITKGNTPVKVKVFNGSGREWNSKSGVPINDVIGLFDANLNTWFGIPIDISGSGNTEDVPYVHSVSCSGNSLVVQKKIMKFKNGILKEIVSSGSGIGTTTTTLSPSTTTTTTTTSI